MADNNTKIVITAEDRTSAAFNSVRTGLQGIDKAAGMSILSLQTLGVTMSAGAFVAFVKNTIDAADAMNDLSQKTGVGVRELAKYDLIAKQSGTSIDAIATGIKAFSKYAVENGETLKKLGIDTKNTDLAMTQLAEVVSKMPDGMEKSAIMTKLFGKAGAELIPVMNLGAKGFEEAAKKSEEYGKRLEELAPKADEFNDKLEELKLYGQGFGVTVATPIVDGLLEIGKAFDEARKKSGEFWAGVQLGGRSAEWIAALMGNPAALIGGTAGRWGREKLGIGSGDGRGASGTWDAPFVGPPAPTPEALTSAILAGEEAEKKAAAAKKAREERLRALKAAQEELNRATEKWLQQIERETGSIGEQLAREKERAETIGMSAQEVANYEAANIDAAAAVKEKEAADLRAAATAAGPLHDAYVQAAADLEEQAAKLREIATLKRSGAAKQAEVDSAKEIAKAQQDAEKEIQRQRERGWEETDRIAREVFSDWAEGGEDAAERIGKTLRAALLSAIYEATLRPIVFQVYGALMGGGNSVAQMASGGSGGFNSYNFGTNSMFSGSLFGAGFQAGSTLGFGATNAVIGESFSQGLYGQAAGAAAAKYLPYVGAAYALSQKQYGTALGTGIGSIWGPAGAAVGGTIGSIVDSFLGGGGEDPHDNAQLSGFNFGIRRAGLYNVGSADNTGVSSFVAGPTSGSGWWADSTALTAAQQAAIMQSVGALFASGESVAKILGLDASALDSVTADATRGGSYSEKLGYYFASVEQAMTSLSDAIAKKLIPNIDSLQQAGETAGQAMARLASEFQFTESIAAVMGRDGGAAFGSLANRSDLVAQLGGVANGQGTFGAYVNAFYGADERAALGRNSIAATLKSLGINNVPGSRGEFRALVEAQDLTTESGRKMYATLLAVSGAFAEITQSADDLAGKLSTDQFRSRVDFEFAQKTGATFTAGDGFGVASELAAMRSDIRAIASAMIPANRKTAKLLDQWDLDGMPETRVLA